MDVHATPAAQGYARARDATAPAAAAGDGGFSALVTDLEQTLTGAETAARAAMLGNGDPHALVEALSASALAVDTVVAVRDKVVEAYQELLRMPV